MKTAVFVPVRIGSTRLPRKPLILIKEKPIIEHLIDRVKAAAVPQLIVLCTTTQPEDAVLGEVARRCRVRFFVGNEKDIIRRFFDAAEKFSVDFIVNVDGDDVFCEPQLIRAAVTRHIETGADFVNFEGFPLGAAPIGFTKEALETICRLKETGDTETGWGRYFTESGLFKVETVHADDEDLRRPGVRITLDYPEDLEFTKQVFNRLYVPGKVFGIRDILSLLDKHPEIAKINQSLQEVYYSEFKKKAAPIRLKKAW